MMDRNLRRLLVVIAVLWLGAFLVAALMGVGMALYESPYFD
jgi:hypothetical protein